MQYAMIRREDPFFVHQRKPNSTWTTLEKMYRQHVPPEARPRSRNETFERAYAYHQHQKAQYAHMAQANDQLRAEAQEINQAYDSFEREIEALRRQFQQLSETQVNERATDGRAARNGRDDRVADTIQAEAPGAAAEPEGLQQPVLPADPPSVGRPADQHGDEGPEPAGGSGGVPDGPDARPDPPEGA